MNATGRKLAFYAIAGMTMLIACSFAWLGLWPILPFAGLEVGVLAWAMETLGMRANDYESLSIRGDEILVERRQGKRFERRTLSCYWTQLEVAGLGGNGGLELAIRSHGEKTVLGIYLTDERKLELAQKLKARLRQGCRNS